MIDLFKKGIIQYDITIDLKQRKNNSLHNLKYQFKIKVYVYDKNMNFIGLYDSAADVVHQMPKFDFTVK